MDGLYAFCPPPWEIFGLPWSISTPIIEKILLVDLLNMDVSSQLICKLTNIVLSKF